MENDTKTLLEYLVIVAVVGRAAELRGFEREDRAEREGKEFLEVKGLPFVDFIPQAVADFRQWRALVIDEFSK